MMFAIELMLLVPAATALLSLFHSKRNIVAYISVIGSCLGLIVSAMICMPTFLDGRVYDYSLWYVDSLSALFLLIISFIALMVSMYSKGYLDVERREGSLTAKYEHYYYFLLNLFIAVMLSACVVNSMGLLWIIIEGTTLVSAFLVGFYNNEHSTEAAWKYLIICSVGITLALVGISLVYASSIGVITETSSALDWSVLFAAASQLDPTLMRAAMVLIIVGFGTKVGFAPMHTWLPDAHSQAPTPVSALLSAVLLNCAFYSILRFYLISEITIPGFSRVLLLLFGFVSLVVAASFILLSKDIKRMLAYSSIEHMGIIAIGFGIGTPFAIFAALFHMMAHSMTKPIMFFTAGNVIQGYGTRDMESIRGLKENMPYTGFMLTAGTLAIVGAPPFAIFVGEYLTISSIIDAGYWWMAVLMLALILIIFAGFTMHIFPMLGGSTEKEVHEYKSIVRAVPLTILFCTTLFFGLFMPDQVYDCFETIVEKVFGGAL
ncbi:MAG: hydrogenase 4 subunit F [Candidatus Methanomethylophilaceae archaeon]